MELNGFKNTRSPFGYKMILDKKYHVYEDDWCIGIRLQSHLFDSDTELFIFDSYDNDQFYLTKNLLQFLHLVINYDNLDCKKVNLNRK